MIHEELQRAVRAFEEGRAGESVEITTQFLRVHPAAADPAQRDRARVYLAAFLRHAGEYDAAADAALAVARGSDSVDWFRPFALVELSIVSRLRHDPRAAERYLDEADALAAGPHAPPDEDDRNCLRAHALHTRAKVLSTLGRHEEAMVRYREARDLMAEWGSATLVNCYVGLAIEATILGRRDEASRYLALAHSTLVTLGRPYAYGLAALFETMAAMQLFVHGSEQGAIDTLMDISEEVVAGYGDFRKVFDVFGELIAGRAEGRFDLDRIRDLVRDYGDDPLITAFLPTLIAGAPRPGDDPVRSHRPDQKKGDSPLF